MVALRADRFVYAGKGWGTGAKRREKKTQMIKIGKKSTKCGF